MTFQQMGNDDVNRERGADNVHSWAKAWSVDERRDICRESSLPFDVMIVNVTGELNVGNIIRTASLCGAGKVHIIGRRKYDARGAVGAENYIDVYRIGAMNAEEIDLQVVCDYIDDKQLYPVFVEQSEYAHNCDFDAMSNIWTRSNHAHKLPCFIFGNEGRGIPQQLIDMYPKRSNMIQLEQKGVIRSFNVGSSAAIVLYTAMQYFKEV